MNKHLTPHMRRMWLWIQCIASFVLEVWPDRLTPYPVFIWNMRLMFAYKNVYLDHADRYQMAQLLMRFYYDEYPERKL